MDIVQPVQRHPHPGNFDTASFPPEAIEHICRFLAAQDITQFSGVNSATYGMLALRVPVIAVAGIDAALSDGRADDALELLASLARWLHSARATLSLDGQMQLWERLLAFAGHAGLSEEQQDSAFRRVFLSACRQMESSPDAVLAFLQGARATWYSTMFPDGTIFMGARPCASFGLVSQYLEGQSYTKQNTYDSDAERSLSKLSAWLGAGIEAISLHQDAADAVTLYTRIARTLKEVYSSLPRAHRTVLSLDMINCTRGFPADEVPALLSLLDPLLASASEEDRALHEVALHGMRVRLHKAVSEDICQVM